MSGKYLLSAKVIIYIFSLFIFTSVLNTAPLFNVPIELKQPDGSVVKVFASGDEYYHWVHDKDNYTITIDDNTGYYVYAQLENDKLVPSKYVVGRTNPLNTSLVKGVNIPSARIKELRDNRKNIVPLSKKTNTLLQEFSNLVIFIRFSDENEFSDNISLYDGYFNSTIGTSLKSYYNEVSWGQMNMQSYFYPASSSGVVSYKDTYPRGYFEKYDAAANPNGYKDEGESGAREKALLIRALTYIKPMIPASLDLDKNKDGYIDNICFIADGDPAGWSDLLWPHMNSLNNEFYINDKRANTYNFELQNSLSAYVLCHEMGHTLGAPDLYAYDYKSNPVGQWDIMAYGQGTHMLNYMNYKYFGWIADIPEITSSGTYSINPSTSPVNNIYKIKSPRHDYEYFLIEYRIKQGLYEKNLPGSGLIVYRINAHLEGNVYAPPDEVYVYRPDGSFESDGTISNAAFSSDAGRTAINDKTNPSSFLSDGGAGGLDISNVSMLGNTMTFDVKIIDKMEDYADPYSSQAAAYNWYDISKTGTVITNWKNGTVTDPSKMDDGYTAKAIPLGFGFNYFGNTFDSIYVGVNGLVSFTQKLLNSSGSSVAGESGENNMGYFAETSWPGNVMFPNSIAVAYYDFDLNKQDGYGGGKVMYQTMDNRFILSWIDAGTFLKGGDTTNTFQLVLDKDAGSITMNYQKFGLDETRSLVKVGMQGIPPSGVSWIEKGLPADRMPQDNSSVIFRPGGATAVNENAAGTRPGMFVLEQNYPNPFNPATTISYQIPASLNPSQGGTLAHVTLRVYDMLGREVAVLVNKEQTAGIYKVNFDAGKYNLSSGVYLYKLSAGELTMTKKLMLLK
jgi:M6 family metalloprotease-like protein